MPRKYWENEPERRAVRYADIPETYPADCAPKGWWDRIIEHLLLIRATDTPVLELKFPRRLHGITAVHNAAARKGLKVSLAISGTNLYVALCGKRIPVRCAPPRKPITCEACGAEIIRPRTGGSKQFVCSGTAKRKSRCQHIRRKARELGMTVAEFLAFKKAA